MSFSRLTENRGRSGSDPLAVMKAQNQRVTDVRPKPKKQSSITSFIYKDIPASTPDKSKKNKKDKEVQVRQKPFCRKSQIFLTKSSSLKSKSKKIKKKIKATPSIEDQLCADEVGEEYWKDLAIEREKALNDTLEENRSLCELIQGNYLSPRLK